MLYWILIPNVFLYSFALTISYILYILSLYHCHSMLNWDVDGNYILYAHRTCISYTSTYAFMVLYSLHIFHCFILLYLRCKKCTFFFCIPSWLHVNVICVSILILSFIDICIAASHTYTILLAIFTKLPTCNNNSVETINAEDMEKYHPNLNVRFPNSRKNYIAYMCVCALLYTSNLFIEVVSSTVGHFISKL